MGERKPNQPPVTELPYFRFNYEANSWQEVTIADVCKPVDQNELTIVQYNTWFGTPFMKIRMKAIVAELERVNADIVCLQEVKVEMLSIILSLNYVRENYYVSDVTGRTLGSYGVLQLFKFPYNKLYLHPLKTRLGRKALLGSFLFTFSDNGNVQQESIAVVTAHLESYPQDVDYRREQMLAIFQILDSFPSAIFTADFNFAEPGEDGVFPDRFVDTWKELKPDDPGYTYDPTNPLLAEKVGISNHPHVRIDRILLRSCRWEPVETELLGNTVFDENLPHVRPSDHYGLMTRIRRK